MFEWKACLNPPLTFQIIDHHRSSIPWPHPWSISIPQPIPFTIQRSQGRHCNHWRISCHSRLECILKNVSNFNYNFTKQLHQTINLQLKLVHFNKFKTPFPAFPNTKKTWLPNLVTLTLPANLWGGHPPSWGKGPEKTGPLWKTMGLNQSCENSTLLQRCQNKSFLNCCYAGFGVCFEDALQFWN